MALSLIDGYFEHYHPYFAILPEKDTFVTRFGTNRLLLWTVFAIAAKGPCNEPLLYSSLVEPVRKLAADIYAPQSRSLSILQALLLLCVWPFPFQQPVNDASPMYCSLAISIGYQLGLHRPDCRADFDQTATAPAMSNAVERNTWYGCFVVQHGLSMRLGIPGMLEAGRAIFTALGEPQSEKISALLQVDLELACCSRQWVEVLDNDKTSASGQRADPITIVNAFENHLAQLRPKFTRCWPKIAEVAYNGVLLQAYAFAIKGTGDSLKSSAVSNASETLDLFHTRAMPIVVHLTTEAVSEHELKRQCWPISTRYNVVFATTVGIYLVATTTKSATKLTLLDACKQAIPVVSGWSMFTKDIWGRFSRLLTMAARRAEARETAGIESVRPLVTARMAANTSYEIMWGDQAHQDGR